LAMIAGAYFGISKLAPDEDGPKYRDNVSAVNIPAEQDTPPDPIAPDPIAPEPVESEPLEPEPVEPEPIAPEPVEPEPVEPEPIEPEPIEPEPIAPEPVEPDPVAPEPIEPEPDNGIILNKTSATLAFTGQTLQLTASISSGADMMLDWESSDHRIAAVDRSGLVTAVSGGTAIITVKTRDGSFAAKCAITVQSSDKLESKDYAYIVTNGKASVVAIDKAISGEVIIPSTLGGYPVVEIGASAFYNCRNVTSVVIPEGVVYIGDDAFCYCYGLKSVSIPRSVTAIGSGVFWDCNKLETVELSANVTSIGDMAFSACNSLSSINVDEGNTSYKSVDGVLYTKDGKTLIQYPRNKSGEIYIIPTDVDEIKNRAFYFCHDLTVVNFSASVEVIGDGAFTGCRFLSEINVDEGNGAYGSADGVLYTKDGEVLIQYPCGKVNRSFEILPGVTSIYRSAFYDCENLRSIFIHKNVSHIGSDAFTRCDNLTIYSEAESQPQLWEKGWNYSNCPVVWGYRQEAEDPVIPEPVEPEPIEPEPVEPEPVIPEPALPEPALPEPVEPEPVEPEPIEPEPVDPEPEEPDPREPEPVDPEPVEPEPVEPEPVEPEPVEPEPVDPEPVEPEPVEPET
ncbi:MAG: leucine-rich repeat protein, partial [Clostridia bacterium]|nr:leucine-rich repeat protein [Clostridia bacterium]